MKTALAISGGGSKGAFAVGAIEVLRNAGFEFDLVSGTSTGALIAPLVAIDDIETLVKLYISMTNKDIIRYNWRKLFWNSIYDTTPLEKWIRKIISEENRYERLMQSKCSILICTVSLQSKNKVYFSQNNLIPGSIIWENEDEFVRAILGSTNQPTLMPAQKIKEDQYIDGGVREVSPLEVLMQTDCERIIIISNSPEVDPSGVTKKFFNNIASVGMRTLDVMSSEISENDICYIIKYNNLLKYTTDLQKNIKANLRQRTVQLILNQEYNLSEPKEIIVIRPEKSLGFAGLEFVPEKMQEARLIGQETAKKILNV